VTPQEVERTFSLHGVRLVENYPNARPGPIIQADYRLSGISVRSGGRKPNGWVTVFDSVHHAAAAKQQVWRIYGKRNVVVRANVLVEFLRDVDKAARQQVGEALSAVAR
jgi:hypothetical protein